MKTIIYFFLVILLYGCSFDNSSDFWRNENEKRKKEELYSRAREALENDDILIMADVASELGVEIPEITENQLKKTEQKIIAIKKELNHIESTLVWHWFFTEDTAVKDKILNFISKLFF